jgi:predicted dehydrogenase
MDGKIIRGPTLQRNYYDFFDGVYNSVNGKEEPVTGEDGLRVMQIIEAAIKVVLRKKQLIYR